MTGARRAHPEPAALRERILREATQLFVERGYNGISMREIAQAVGISKAGLYYHFADKQALFLAILHASLDELERLIGAVRAGGRSTREQVTRVLTDLLALPPERRAVVRLASQELAQLAPDARAEFSRRYEAQFLGQIEALLREGVARGELRPLDLPAATWVLLGMIYPFFAPHGRDAPSADDVVDLVVSLFFDGAAP